MDRNEIIEAIDIALSGYNEAKQFFCIAVVDTQQYRIVSSDAFRPLVDVVNEWLTKDAPEGGISEDEAMNEIMSIFQNQNKNEEDSEN